ncbi:MAG TPA: HD domain-containing protein [Bryobacteraceae bacterium]|jgi:phosphonate degradation associated HDIG domain protein|nr:HD domain-containing protein [Bryobacteraceae bacterium]
MTVAQEVSAIFSEKGQSSYFGEPVSQLEHALQAAHFAREEDAPDRLVVAALLHDIGHLVEDIPEDTADLGIDAKHEQIGEWWLSQRFGPEVYEPVYLHVAAKRYLCATDSTYFSRLSPASVQSLHLQGGPLSVQEVAAFEEHRHFRDAVRLRLWDDRAKVAGLATEDLSRYAGLIQQAALSTKTIPGRPQENR